MIRWRKPSFLSSAATALIALACAASVTACHAARGAAPPPSPLIGTWSCGTDSNLMATCAGSPISPLSLSGVTVAIRTGAGADLWLDIGCRCHVPLAISGADPNVATLATATECPLVYGTLSFDAAVETTTMRLDPSSGTIDVEMRAGTTEVPSIGTCESSALTAVLSLVSRTPGDCGPADSALGVVPYDPEAQRSCPISVGREGVMLVSQDESDDDCLPKATGDDGESAWALPLTEKPKGPNIDLVSCTKHDPSVPPVQQTHQHFCRVDGRGFKPLTTDPNATQQFYAVLKLSPDGAPCPNGSIEMVRKMDTEDDVNYGRVVGDVGPNHVGATNLDTFTILHFCFFRWADDAAATMSAFPDLGFPYAVYHDFDGPQPTWVNLKRYVYSRNEVSGSQNAVYREGVDDPLAVEQFKSIIEPPTAGTVFDLGWVR